MKKRYDVYEPGEDSELIFDQIKHYSKGYVLDMGTGTGILAIEAAKYCDLVTAADINPDALKFAEKEAKKNKIKNIEFIKSDLFRFLKKNNYKGTKFDLIIFNPPYLPEDKREPEESRLATTGGKKGHELIERFFSDVNDHLEDDGKVLLLFSSLTDKEKIHEILEDNAFNFQLLNERKTFFETLYVYLAEKSEFLKEMNKKGIKNLRRFDHGKRGVIYKGKLKNKDIAIKKKLKSSKAISRMENEAEMIRLVNKKDIGPKFISSGKDYVIYEFVKGKFILDFIKDSSKERCYKAINEIFKQCYILDRMLLTKEEMHHPLKHIIIDKKPVMIDFERMHHSEKPKNVTQFCQFLVSSRITELLKEKGLIADKKMLDLAKKYKKDMSDINLNKIMACFH